MMTPSSNGHQTDLFGNNLLQQLDPQDPLLVLATAIPWKAGKRRPNFATIER